MSQSPTFPLPPRPTAGARLRALLARPALRVAALSAGAAALAYGIGSATTSVSAVVAAITALITVRPTFHASMQEAARQVLGVVIGALVAFAALWALGFSAAALFIAILACFLTAWWLRLGEEGAVAVGVTVILVAGPHLDTEAIETRLLGALLGGVIALVFSYFTRPGTPHARALTDTVRQADRVAALLTTMAETLGRHEGRVPQDTAREWLAEAEGILRLTVTARHDAQDAVDGARWSPMIAREDAEAVLAQVRITEGTVVTVLGMCRDLIAAAEDVAPLPAGLATSLSQVLLATAGAISEQSESAMENPAEALASHTGPVHAVDMRRHDATAQVRSLDDTMPLLLGGSLLRDTEKITDLLSGH